MLKKAKSWHAELSKAGKVLLWSLTTVVVGTAVGSAVASTTPPSPSVPTSSSSTSQPTVEKKTVIETQAIAFDKKTVNNATLDSGKTELQTKGVNGIKTLTYEVTYENGLEKNRSLIKEEITTQPIAEVTAIGTKVYTPPVTTCSGGYINVNGNCVKSPGDSSSGASARCGDGSYSYSQNRSGTCSHHGGVAEWL